jgi:hypothetical protein
VVDNTDARTKIRNVATDGGRLADFADVADRLVSVWHVKATRAVQADSLLEEAGARGSAGSIPEVRFASDSALEEGGFEPSVPLSKTPRLRPRSNRINLRT